MPVRDADISFFDLVGNMRAMRRLKPDPIPPELIRKVINAGVQAPSGMNLQPWSFLVIRDPKGKKWFAEKYKAAIQSRFETSNIPADTSTKIGRMLASLQHQVDHMHESPVILIVCGKRDWPFKVPEHERVGLAPPNFGAIYPCVQNILLACRALGLGAALTTMHQVFEDELMERFEIPEDFGVVVTIPIGYPTGNFGPVSRKPAEEVTYYDRWGFTSSTGSGHVS